MKRQVMYYAADQKAGFTPQELRDALKNAIGLGRANMRWNRKIVSIEVEETESGARIEGA